MTMRSSFEKLKMFDIRNDTIWFISNEYGEIRSIDKRVLMSQSISYYNNKEPISFKVMDRS